MTLLINLKKADHQNNEVFVYCFRFFKPIRTSKVNLSRLPVRKGGKKEGVTYLAKIGVKAGMYYLFEALRNPATQNRVTNCPAAKNSTRKIFTNF